MDRLDLQGLCHEGHDIGLRNGLGVSDGQGGIVVSQRTRGFWNEHVARHMEHRVQHAGVMNPRALSCSSTMRRRSDSRSPSRLGSGLPAPQVNAALTHAARNIACCTTT